MKHVRYVGNAIAMFSAVVISGFTIFPIVAIPFILKSEISAATISISAFCVLFIVSIFLYCRSVNVAIQLYTWYVFRKDNVAIHPLFYNKYEVEYTNCSDVGVGYYIHGVLNSNIGSEVLFIYLSYHKVDPKYKCQMNLLKPTQTCIKIGFRKKTYQYLLDNLPQKQSKMLEKSYADFQGNHGHSGTDGSMIEK